MLTQEKLFTVIPKYSQDAIQQPCFENIRFSYDEWQYYVPESLQKLWSDLSIESRCVIYCMADQMAETAIERTVGQGL